MILERNSKEDTGDTGKMPVLFIGHGSPMNVILRNKFTNSLAKLGKELSRPRAIMVISAHWLTGGTYVTCMERPRTIYDFYGFPDELYEMKYPCRGSPDDARFVKESIQKVQIKCNNDWFGSCFLGNFETHVSGSRYSSI